MRIPKNLRMSIAANIRDLRMRNYPGRGGGKKCAEAFGVTPQQWSPWERGGRTPDEIRLRQIAEFFGVAVEDLLQPHRVAGAPPLPGDPPDATPAAAVPTAAEYSHALTRLLNLANRASMRIAVPLMNSLADALECAAMSHT